MEGSLSQFLYLGPNLDFMKCLHIKKGQKVTLFSFLHKIKTMT